MSKISAYPVYTFNVIKATKVFEHIISGYILFNKMGEVGRGVVSVDETK